MNPNSVAQLVKNIDPNVSIMDIEGRALYKLAKETKSNIVEIGSWKGRSTIWLAKGYEEGYSKGHVYAVDPHQSTDTHSKEKESNTFKDFSRNIISARVENIVAPLVMTSVEAARKLGKERVEIGLVFIDGSHELEEVYKDFNSWSSLLVIGGTLVLHDTIGYKGPKEVAKSLLKDPYFNYLGFTGQLVYAKKVLPKKKKKLRNLVKYLQWKLYSIAFLIAKRILPRSVKEVLKA